MDQPDQRSAAEQETVAYRLPELQAVSLDQTPPAPTGTRRDTRPAGRADADSRRPLPGSQLGYKKSIFGYQVKGGSC